MSYFQVRDQNDAETRYFTSLAVDVTNPLLPDWVILYKALRFWEKMCILQNLVNIVLKNSKTWPIKEGPSVLYVNNISSRETVLKMESSFACPYFPIPTLSIP